MIRIENLRFSYPRDGFTLRIPQLHVPRNTAAAIVGPSGAGKTTLLNLISGVLRPEEGDIAIDNMSLRRLSSAQRRRFRISRVGMVFQELELLEYLSVRENILLPYFVNSSLTLDASVRRRAEQLAEAVGLGDKLTRFPRLLSQGERQRAVICRALLTRPQLLMADEPTGNLDEKNASRMLDLLFEQFADTQATLLVVTHDQSALDRFDLVVDVASIAQEKRS